MDEVDRLAEMERQRRIREAEQKVVRKFYTLQFYVFTLLFTPNTGFLSVCESLAHAL